MAFIPLTSTEIDVGKPNSNQVAQKIKDNLDNHESRLTTVEGGGAVTYPPMILRVSGSYDSVSPTTMIVKDTVSFDTTITGVRLIIDKAGTTGSTTIDLKYKRGAGAWTSLLTVLPSVSYTAGDDAISTNTVLDASKVHLLAGDLLAAYITTVQSEGRSFMIRVDYSKT